MKTVLLSTKPYWIFLIIAKTMGWKTDKEKTVEVRKSYPKNKDWDKTVILYCTKDKNSFNQIPKEYQPIMERLLGKVIGEFVCDRIYRLAHCGTNNQDIALRLVDKNYSFKSLDYGFFNDCQLSYHDIKEYSNGNDVYTWHISDLKIYDKPKELSEFEMCNTYKGKWDKNGTRSKKIVRPPQSWCYVRCEK